MVVLIFYLSFLIIFIFCEFFLQFTVYKFCKIYALVDGAADAFAKCGDIYL